MYDPLLAKETNEHSFQFAFFIRAFWVFETQDSSIAKIAVLSLVRKHKRYFIACDDVQEECGIVYQFPSVPDRWLLECLSDRGSTLSAQT